jgi:hypothetical protein
MTSSTKHITKLCAQHLCAFVNNHGSKLKSTDAHEIVAAILGYNTRATMLADEKFHLYNLANANIIVMPTIQSIELRLRTLTNLLYNLPSIRTLSDVVYDVLKSEGLIHVKIWSSFEEMAPTLVYNEFPLILKNIKPAPSLDNLKVEVSKEYIYLYLSRKHEKVDPLDKYRGSTSHEDICTSIYLNRIAAHIGYAKPTISPIVIPHSRLKINGV